MKRIYKILSKLLCLLLLIQLTTSCEDDSVSVLPVASFEVDSQSEFEQGKVIKFTNLSTDAYSYLWSFGDGDTYVGVDAEHTYSNAGNYRVVLEANGNGQRAVYAMEITITANEYEIYFIDNDAQKLRKLTLSNPSDVIDVFNLPGFCIGLDYDALNDEIYYTDDDNQILYKNNLSGTAEVEIASGFAAIRDIALDINNDKVYVVDKNSDAVNVIDLNTQTTSTLYSVADDPLFLLPVGIDILNDQLYITAVDFDAETVWKGNVNGSGIGKIIDYNSGGYGYGITINPNTNQIYFDDADGGTILSSDLDGGNIASFGATTDRVYGLTVIEDLDKIVWTSRDGKINISNSDKTENSLLVDLASDIRGVFSRKVK